MSSPEVGKIGGCRRRSRPVISHQLAGKESSSSPPRKGECRSAPRRGSGLPATLPERSDRIRLTSPPSKAPPTAAEQTAPSRTSGYEGLTKRPAPPRIRSSVSRPRVAPPNQRGPTPMYPDSQRTCRRPRRASPPARPAGHSHAGDSAPSTRPAGELFAGAARPR